jgi:hypothetical protein
MALSNKLARSCCHEQGEMSVGYCALWRYERRTVIADLPKMMVYRVSRWRNNKRDIRNDFDEAPSAELRPDKPTRTASAVRVIGRSFTWSSAGRRKRSSPKVTERQPFAAYGWFESQVQKQAAPVLKVTSRAFGTGWRMPIVRQE